MGFRIPVIKSIKIILCSNHLVHIMKILHIIDIGIYSFKEFRQFIKPVLIRFMSYLLTCKLTGLVDFQAMNQENTFWD